MNNSERVHHLHRYMHVHAYGSPLEVQHHSYPCLLQSRPSCEVTSGQDWHRKVKMFIRLLDRRVQRIWQNPNRKVHGVNMRPIWDWQGPGGPHVDPMNLAIWVIIKIPERQKMINWNNVVVDMLIHYLKKNIDIQQNYNFLKYRNHTPSAD